jgi:hypothetical protein
MNTTGTGYTFIFDDGVEKFAVDNTKTPALSSNLTTKCLYTSNSMATRLMKDFVNWANFYNSISIDKVMFCQDDSRNKISGSRDNKFFEEKKYFDPDNYKVVPVALSMQLC